MISVIQHIGHIKKKVESAISLYDDCIINKEELKVLLGRYLTEDKIKVLLERLNI